MTGFVYNFLLIILSPVIFVAYLWRVLVSGKSKNSWRENLGNLPNLAERPDGCRLIWIHGASVGETAASLSLRKEIRRLVPDAMILVTTITRTGNEFARKTPAHADAVAYFPLDFPCCINKALDRIRPDIFITVEAELWPNFLAQVKHRRIPTLLVNGRISDRTMQRCKWWGWLIRWAISNLDYCCMQTELDAERIRSMGANQESVRVSGSIKVDQEGGRLSLDQASALRADLGLSHDALVFVAGSTNPGEDSPVLDAYLSMRASFHELKLIIAPRQLERAGEIVNMVSSRKLKCVRRSDDLTNTGGYDVLILDTFGELAVVYAAADITFVGGTLIRKGGHSIIQPIIQGKPVFFGPHIFKTRDMAQLALSAGVGFMVKDADDLARKAKELLGNTDIRRQIQASCEQLVNKNAGASSRCAKLIVSLIEERKDAA